MTQVIGAVRDRLVLNGNLQARIQRRILNGEIPRGASIVFSAREIVLPPNQAFVVDDRALVFFADSFDASLGRLQVTVPPAGVSQDGQTGQSVTVVCRKFYGGDFVLHGGEGGEGAPGATGKQGDAGPLLNVDLAQGRLFGAGYDDISVGHPNDVPQHVSGGPGENGSPGERGASGGPGGSLTLLYVEGDPTRTLRVDLVGGIGGRGGQGGPGGLGGEPGDAFVTNFGPWYGDDVWRIIPGYPGQPGLPGDVGSTGPVGKSQPAVVTQLSLKEFHGKVADAPEECLAFRLRVGEYYFRAWQTSHPVSAHFGDFALNEFATVARATTTGNQALNARAVLLEQRLLAGQNILGQPRNLDVQPNFNKYEDQYLRFYQFAEGALQSGVDAFRMAPELKAARASLQHAINCTDVATDALALEQQGAERLIQEATLLRDSSEKKVAALQQQAATRQAELEAAQVSVDQVIDTVFGIFGAVATIVTGGAGLVAFAPALLDLGQFVSKKVKEEGLISTIKHLEDARTKANTLKGAVDEIKGGKPALLNFPELVSNLWAVQISAKEEEYKRLLGELAAEVEQFLISNLRLAQATLARDAVLERIKGAEASRVPLVEAVQHLDQDGRVVRDFGLVMVRTAQQLLDPLLGYIFQAVRAVEIYTHEDLSSEIRYDYGHVHPDLEMDYMDDAVSAVSLASAYELSWRSLGKDLIKYRVRYDNYDATAGYQWLRLSIDDAQQLARFRANQDLPLRVLANELPPDAFEAKVHSMKIALVGAGAKSDVVSVNIEHGGVSHIRRSSMVEQDVVLEPHRGIALARTEPLDSDGGVVGAGSPTETFWGRGVAANWRIWVEPYEVAREQLALDALSQIQIWIHYAFFPPKQLLLLTLKRIEGVVRRPLWRGVLPRREKILLSSVHSERIFAVVDGVRLEVDKDRVDVMSSDYVFLKAAAKTLRQLPWGGPAPSPEIYRDGDGQYRWNIRDEPECVLARSSEGYSERIDCERALDAFGKAPRSAISMFVDKDGGVRWRYTAKNGRIIATGARSYDSEIHLARDLRLSRAAAALGRRSDRTDVDRASSKLKTA